MPSFGWYLEVFKDLKDNYHKRNSIPRSKRTECKIQCASKIAITASSLVINI